MYLATLRQAPDLVRFRERALNRPARS